MGLLRMDLMLLTSLLQKYELWFDRLTTNGKGCSTGSPRTGKVVRQAHHERERWFDRLTTNGIIKIPFTLSLSKGVFGVLQEALT